MAEIIDIGKLIVSDSRICGGLPRIAGTRMSICNIALDYKGGMSAEEIASEFPHLTKAQIYTALAYYHANKEQIETDIAAYKTECEHWKAEYKAGRLQ